MLAPEIKAGDWIRIGSIDCVVSSVRGEDDGTADVRVLCNADQPAEYDANWQADGWAFAHPMRGQYAQYLPNVSDFVEVLRKGRPAD